MNYIQRVIVVIVFVIADNNNSNNNRVTTMTPCVMIISCSVPVGGIKVARRASSCVAVSITSSSLIVSPHCKLVIALFH